MIKTQQLNVLAVDDDVDIRTFFSIIIEKTIGNEIQLFTAEEADEAYDIVKNNTIDLIFSDFHLPDGNGYDLMLKIKALNPEIDTILMTANADIRKAVEVLKAGADDYLIKPIDRIELEKILQRYLEKKQLIQENEFLKEQLHDNFNFKNIIYQSQHMDEVLNLAGRSARSNVNVLIQGESGTGKDLIANAIHYSSTRKNKPFIVVNIAALSESLIESELFGHVKGAFTGAHADRIGRFEQANNGTLFIDEVGEIPLHIQVKLLRAIQFKEIERIGDSCSRKINVRIICATNQNLQTMILEKKFREDLYYRLNVILIHVKPLRERKEDIVVLTDFFIKKFAKENDIIIDGISKEAMDTMIKYQFPGNVRELENIILRSVVLCRTNIITTKDLPPNISNFSEKNITYISETESSLDEKVHHFEKILIQDALSRFQGNQSAAARFLKVSERKLRSRMKILNIVNRVKNEKNKSTTS